MLRFQDHRIDTRYLSDLIPEYTFVYTPNFTSQHPITPFIALIHYTAGGHADTTASWCSTPESKVSYHFIIDRGGKLIQMVPCNFMAWHAGRSTWEGRKDINFHSIGIGLANHGHMTPAFQGAPLALNNTVYAGHKSNPNLKMHWEKFYPPQIQTLYVLLCALVDNYGIKIVLGHDDVAPDRKIDPGPAFPPLPFRIPETGYRKALREWLPLHPISGREIERCQHLTDPTE